VTTSISGSIVVELPVNTYHIIEIEAPSGYRLNSIPKEQELLEGTMTVLEVPNSKAFMGRMMSLFSTNNGNVKIIANSAEDGQVVAGVEYQLQNSNGQVIADKLVTNKDGEITVNGLSTGEYTIINTASPEGFEKSNEQRKVVVNEDIDNIVNVVIEKETQLSSQVVVKTTTEPSITTFAEPSTGRDARAVPSQGGQGTICFTILTKNGDTYSAHGGQQVLVTFKPKGSTAEQFVAVRTLRMVVNRY